MAETDEIYELGWELGFFWSVSNAVYTLLVLKCYTWRFHWDVSWMLYHRKIQNFKIDLKLSKSKFVQNFQIRVYFSVYGVGPVFWVWTGSLPVLTQKMSSTSTSPYITILIHHKPTTSSVCASRVFQSERVVYHHWFACTMGLSTVPVCQPCLEVCQHARGSSLKCLCFPGHGSQRSQMSWRPRHCATVPDGSNSTRLYLWFRFICNDDIWLFYSLMWWPIGCVCHH